MDIEAENPNAGEAPPSEVPVSPDKVQQLVQNHFHGPVGNIAQNSSGFTQTATLNLEDVSAVVKAIRPLLVAESVGESARTAAIAQVTTIEAQLASPAPNEGIIREAGRSLRNIVEAAIGNAVVLPGVWTPILQTLTSLFGG
jgi:hypothetical protein